MSGRKAPAIVPGVHKGKTLHTIQDIAYSEITKINPHLHLQNLICRLKCTIHQTLNLGHA